jgi:hypothetical protein
MTLMTAGYNAPDAIRFVILHGLADGVGGEVQTLSLSGRKPRKSS